MCNSRTMFVYPTSQGELIRAARGTRTQAEFAKLLGCDRSCLSRYEREQLGASPMVISRCLDIVAKSMRSSEETPRPYERALAQARRVVAELERLGDK
ncbi:helix-turn-helix transcriptional regulator [Acidovorax kalamii]